VYIVRVCCSSRGGGGGGGAGGAGDLRVQNGGAYTHYNAATTTPVWV